MIYWLLFIMIIIFSATYVIFKDLFHPAMIICESYILSSLCACYNANSWGADLLPTTITLLVIGVVSFILGALAITFLPTTRIKAAIFPREDIKVRADSIYIDNIVSYLLILSQGFILVLYTIFWLKAIGGFPGFASLPSAMTQYRYALSYEQNVENPIPMIVSQLTKISKAVAYIYMYVHLHNHFINKINSKNKNFDIKFWLAAVLYLTLTLMTGARFEMLVFLIAYMVMWRILGVYYGQNGTSIKTIFAIVGFVIFGVFVFSISRTWVGRTDSSDILSYFTKVFGGSIKLFDAYLKKPTMKSNIFGKETFYAINKFLYQIGFLDITYNRHLEFRTVNGITLGNVYTSVRSMYHDFGVLGVILLQFLLGSIMTFFYRAVQKDINGKINVKLIFYCIIVHVVYFSAYLELFYNTVLSVNYILFLICLLVISWIINHIHFKTA